jgi:hypothetical protein
MFFASPVSSKTYSSQKFFLNQQTIPAAACASGWNK